MIVDKNCLVELINDVVFPFHNFLDKLEVTKRYLDSDEKRLKHKLDTAILAVALIKNPKFAKDKLQKASIAHNDLDIDYKEMKDALNIFFKLLLLFLVKKGNCKEFEEKLDDYNNFFMQVYAPKKAQDNTGKDNEEDFFDFDSEFVDEEIDKMHFKDYEKVSAEEFMQSNIIDDYDIADISDILEEFHDKSSYLNSVTTQYIEEFGKTISKFEIIFNSSYEFKNIAYALNKLYNDLSIFDFKYLESDQKELFKLLLDSIIEDLAKFYLEVLVEKTAIDIHYLDASLLANISQIEIVLNQIKGA